MDKDKKKDLRHALEAAVIARGREENTLEFYDYLAKNIRHPEARRFFQALVKKEASDIKHTENLLKELEKDIKDIDKIGEQNGTGTKTGI